MLRRQTSTKRVLITGGAGFIGSHLAETLLADGCRVTALDNLSTGSTRNLSRVENESRFDLVVGDVCDEQLVDRLAAEADVIFHMAAAVGVRLILADPIESFRSNVLGTESVLKAGEAHGTKVMIASTSEVYGKVVRIPQREDDDVLLGPTSFSRWSYAACKMLDEFIGLAYARRGMPVVCFRLFNTVGPRQTGRYGMVVPRFVDAALRGEPLQVHGDGSQSRCFLHVHDAVEAIRRLEHNPRCVGEVFNVGSTESISIMDLAKRVLQTTNVDDPGMISLVPYSEAYPDGDFEDIRARKPSLAKIRAATNWRPRLSLDTILRDIVAEREAVVVAETPRVSVTTAAPAEAWA